MGSSDDLVVPFMESTNHSRQGRRGRGSFGLGLSTLMTFLLGATLIGVGISASLGPGPGPRKPEHKSTFPELAEAGA